MSTYWLKACDLHIATAEGQHVVNSNATILIHSLAILLRVRHLWHSFICTILGGLEIDGSCPVVAEVVGVGARSASRGLIRSLNARIHLGDS